MQVITKTFKLYSSPVLERSLKETKQASEDANSFDEDSRQGKLLKRSSTAPIHTVIILFVYHMKKK